MSKISKLAADLAKPESSIMIEARLESDHAKAAIADGAPAAIIRAPETPEQTGDRRKRFSATTPPPTARPGAAPAQPSTGAQEEAVKTATMKKTAPTQAAPTPAAKVDVVAQVAEMTCRKTGASMDEMCQATGLKAHPMGTKLYMARHKLGYTIEFDKEKGRYFGKRPSKAG